MRGARGDEEGARGMRCAPLFLGEKDELAVGETAKGALIYRRGGGVGGGDAGLVAVGPPSPATWLVVIRARATPLFDWTQPRG
ncbi:hypothetical protein BHE74_00031463 [Ensete ventricosum]|nr:hypothetical protein GW17_00044623 [Ensete ventricosum]RWW61479.1 hypothetical protein BHE74_00031463 [Ensete ventricosum]